MESKLIDLLSKKTEFLSVIDKDLIKSSNLVKEIENELDSLNYTRKNLRNLCKKPEHEALIPLCKLLYVPARIKHTGEYLLEKKASPNSYLTLKTSDQCISELDMRLKDQDTFLRNTNATISQLEARKRVLLGQQMQIESDIESCFKLTNNEVADEEMPAEIKSERGMAFKVGSFYEIIEFE